MPLCLRALELKQELNIGQMYIKPTFSYRMLRISTHTWSLSPIRINLELAEYNKSITSKTEYKELFGRIKNEYIGYMELDTDGSKTDSRVGAAAVCGNVHKLKALLAEASIFTDEACTMQLAMSIIEEENRRDYIIFSDSLSVLKPLQASNQDTMISALQHVMDAETKRSKKIQLC